MNNREPTSELLRLSDVLAWLPRVSRYQLHVWEEIGVIRTLRVSPTSRRYYYLSDLRKVLNGDVDKCQR